MIAASKFSSQVLNKLRPPCSRNTTVVYGYAREGRTNQGLTLRLPSADEPVVAPGNGTVVKIVNKLPDWKFATTALANRRTYEITIDHGVGVTTVIAGLSAADVFLGQPVQRGDRIGPPLTDEIFFAIVYNGASCNPTQVSRHFQLYDDRFVLGQSQSIRFAPDRLIRDITRGVTAVLLDRIHYFIDQLRPSNYLISVDFNGDTTKKGLAATGIGPTDYWTVYTPSNFSASPDYGCGYYGMSFSSLPLQWLYDWRAHKSAARIEKLVESPTPYYGSAATWDVMMGTWIGGYTGPTPVQNSFNILSVPSGEFDLYVYTRDLAETTVYVSVNGGTPEVRATTPAASTTWVEGANYVRFSLIIHAGDTISVSVYGYLCGMQLRRTAF